MSHHNLVLTEKAIKSHSKRLQKEMLESNIKLSVTEAQNLFSRILGFQHYHDLKSILNIDGNNNIKITSVKLSQENDFYNFTLNNKNMDSDKKQKFIENIPHFMVNEKFDNISEITKKKEYYNKLEKMIKEQEYDNEWAIIDYLESCIKDDNLPEFIEKYDSIPIEKDYDHVYDYILNANAQNIAKYVINLPNIKNKEDKAQAALGAFAFHNNLDMVKLFLTYPKVEIDDKVIMLSCFYENNVTLKYLIDGYKAKNPKVKDFSNLIEQGIILCCQQNALNNFKLLVNLPNKISIDFIIKTLMPKLLNENSDDDDKKHYDKRLIIGKRFLDFLINELNFKISTEVKTTFGLS